MARTVAGAAPGRTNRRFLIIAVLFAALSGALVFAWMNSQSGKSDSGSAAGGSRQVVVAKTIIKQRTEITADMVEVKSIPANAVIEGGFATVDEVVGKIARLPLEVNQQVVANGIVDTNRPVADALSQVVPNGRRGYSITATQLNTAGGLILPGDYVDVIWVCCTNENIVTLTRTVVQNVQVAALAQNIIDAGPVASGDGTGVDEDPVAVDKEKVDSEAVTITLLVSPDQADLLAMAENLGDMRVALRGPSDTNIDPPEEDFTLVTELLPPDVLQALPKEFWPKGYKPEGTQ